MPESIVTSPKGAYKTVSDYTTGLAADGTLIPYYQRIIPFRANEALEKWEACCFVAATATVPLSVEKLDTSDTSAGLATTFIGVTQETAAAGDIVPLCVAGYTLVQVDTTDPVFNSAAGEGAADGTLGAILIGSLDATVPEAHVFGVFLDVETSADLAMVWLYGRG